MFNVFNVFKGARTKSIIALSIVSLSALTLGKTCNTSCEKLTNPSEISRDSIKLLFDSGCKMKQLQQIHPYSSTATNSINKLFYGYDETKRDIFEYCDNNKDFYHVINPYGVPEDEMIYDLVMCLYKMKHAQYIIGGKKIKHLFYDHEIVMKALSDLKSVIKS